MFAGLTLAGGISAIKQAIQLGDEIGKAAVKAGLGAKQMSELAYAARLADIDLGSLSNSLRFMQVNLSKATTGGKEQLEVLKALGLNLSDLKRLSPDQQFESFAQAISSLKDPADKARAAVALFGKAGADLLPLFEQGAEGIRKAREEAKKFGASFDEDVIQTLQKGDDAIKKLGVTWDVFWANMAVGAVHVAEALDIVNKDAIGELKDQLALAEKQLQDATMMPDGGMFDPKAYKAAADAVDILRRQIVNLESTYSRGSSRRGHAAPSAPGFAATGGVGAFTKSDFSALMDGADLRRSIADFQEWRGLVDDVDRGIGKGIIQSNEDIGDSFRDLQEPILDTKDEMTVFADEAARNMQDAFADFLFDPFEDGLKGMLRGFIDIIRRMVAEAASAKIFESIGGTSGIGNFLGSLFGSSSSTSGDALDQMFSLYGGPKAGGGPLTPGKWHMAGEHGPEPIWGGGPGAFAMGYGGGGQSVSISIDARGSTQESVRMMPSIVRQAAELAKAELREDTRRGRGRG